MVVAGEYLMGPQFRPGLKYGIALAGLLLTACGSSNTETDKSAGGAETTSTPNSGTTTAASEAPSAFGICSTCHSAEKGRNGIGPSLFGIVGTKAGAVENYNFSSAMKSADIIWDEKNLDQFIENPRGLVPGTKMPFAGMTDPAKRAEIVAYLVTLK
jgi:cytochrome c